MIELLEQTSYQRDQIKALIGPVLRQHPRLNGQSGGPRSSPLRVLLKPNFVVPAPRSDASTTHPEFYMAIAELLQELGCVVGIGESPAIGSCAGGLKAHGVFNECVTRAIEVVEFRAPREYPGVKNQRPYETLTIASELRNWDVVINCPKLKTHQQFTFTGYCKLPVAHR